MKQYFKNAKGIVPIEKWEKNCWVHFESPTEEEKRYMIEELGVPLSFYNDLEDIDERPRIDDEDDWYLIILRFPFRNSNSNLPYNTAPLGLIFKEDVFITISNVKTEMINDFITYTNRKNKNYSNYFDLVLRLVLSASVWFLKYLKQIDQLIKITEQRLQKLVRNEELQTLLAIEKCLVYFSTSIRGNDILIKRINNIKIQKDNIDPELLEDVEIELKQAQETTGIYSNILSSLMDAYASVISNDLNKKMKQLTSISIVLMIPTLVASLYGMNVPNFFEDFKFAFFGVLLISIILSIFAVFMFKRKNWF